MKNRKREICTSGTVRDEGGNILIYSATHLLPFGNISTLDLGCRFEVERTLAAITTLVASKPINPTCGADARGRCRGCDSW
jgi:hypothetical protein